MLEPTVVDLPAVPGEPDPAPMLARPSTGRALIRLARPKQWVKNLLVFAAPGAAGILSSPSVAARAGLAFVAFSAVASSTYVVNDVLDLAADRAHPTKRQRPLAARTVSVSVALVFAAAMLVVGTTVASLLGLAFLEVVGLYIALTLAYSAVLKRIEVIDIAVVAACFVLRAAGGGAATGVAPSSWFLILTSAGALFVVAGKRLADLRHARAAGSLAFARRAAYPEPFLRSVGILAGALAVMAYCLWSLAVPHDIDGVAWSQVSIVPFVIALLRYGLVIERGEASAPEEVFFSDHVLQVAVLVWIATFAVGVYG